MKNTPRLFFIIFHSSSPISMSEILLKPKNYLELRHRYSNEAKTYLSVVRVKITKYLTIIVTFLDMLSKTQKIYFLETYHATIFFKSIP